jgi:GntR family transcriptional regulator/MocR family aminotransferase
MYLKLDGRGPRYTQLTRAMKAAMLSGRIGAGERLPPTRALAGELGLSRNTVLNNAKRGCFVARVERA